EEVNQDHKADVVDIALRHEHIRNLPNELTVGSPRCVLDKSNDERREDQQTGRKNDRHDPRLIHTQWQELALPSPHNATSADVFSTLNRNPTLPLGNHDDPNNDENEESSKE